MRYRCSPAAVMLLLAAGAAAQPVPVGSELQVNVTIPGPQTSPAAAAGPSGLHAVAWQGLGTSTDVWLRVWKGDGTLLVPELRVNSQLSGCQEAPDISFGPDGSFVVVWQSEGQDGSGWGIFGQRFAANGSLAGPEFQVNAATSGDQQAPAVANGPSGFFTVVWESFGQDGDGWGVYARRFNAAGSLGGEVQVASSGTGSQRRPDVVAQPTGHVLVAWEGPDGSGPGVFVRRFAADLTAPGSAVQMDSVAAGFQSSPSLACDDSGNMIAAWERGADVVARRFDRFLAPLDGVFTVPPSASGLRTRPRVGSSGSGDFLVAWEGWSQDGGGPGVFLRAFDFLEMPQTSAVPVNTFIPGAQHRADVAVSSQGRVLTAWESEEQDGDGAGVFGQRFAFPGLDFYTLVPCRVFDTRQSTPLQSGVERVFAISGNCGVPVTARAVSVNVTVVSATATGEVVLYAGDLAVPGTSSSSFRATLARANNAILGLARNGAGTLSASASLGASGTVHLILDVNGYFQ
ncbi:MAG TPA: hypothetical protein VFR31_02230 [Thermoanaerobaculia bacterium]|nr:hypothetical protein [Thermoanaerobaculia bacterium]